jgi:hypothetical protein
MAPLTSWVLCLAVQVVTDATLQQLCWAEVQQAFLPKFENEGQDQSIAADIVAGASDRCAYRACSACTVYWNR